MTIATTFRSEAEKIERVDALAAALNRSRNWVLNKAVDDLLEYNEWFVSEVNKGVAAADAGRLASPERVQAIFDKYRGDKHRETTPSEAKSRGRD